MKMRWALVGLMAGGVWAGDALGAEGGALPARQMERLGRGVVGIREKGGVFVSWRLLGTEGAETAFNVYRVVKGGAAVKLNGEPLRTVTWWRDAGAPGGEVSYVVKAVVGGKEGEASSPWTVGEEVKPYLSVPLRKVPAGYAANDCSVGDLDGDGEYEIVVHLAGRAHDNSHAGETDPPVFQAYKLDGTLLWTFNLGRNIREGAHYTQFMVYDLDGDGKAEIVMKTGDGSTDAAGKVIGDAKANWVNNQGRIITGPEYLSVFEGATGKVLYTTNYYPPRGENLKQVWGDEYGNRFDRFNACVAYLDGVHPSVVMCRGYYTRTVLAAYDWKNGKLVPRWVFDSDDPQHPEQRAYRGQGNHNLSVADVDGDGKDEIVYGAMCVDDNGKGLWTTGYGHGDAQHVSDLDPEKPGLEFFGIQERFDDAGSHFCDARTGKTYWKKPSKKAGEDGEGPGRALALDIDPRYPGYECWSFGAGITGLYDCKGKLISEKTPRSCNFGVLWDGDTLYELLDRNHIDKWDWEAGGEKRLLTAEGAESNNGTKATPCLSGDILGDWREEVLWRSSDGKELRLYVTTMPTDRRMYTLMHDPQYRLSIAWQNVSYNQPPHPGFYLGAGMKEPPKPNIVLVGGLPDRP